MHTVERHHAHDPKANTAELRGKVTVSFRLTIGSRETNHY